MASEFLFLAAIGFLAQLVDGALGMAFGLISTTFMLAIGLPPAYASAVVHTLHLVLAGIWLADTILRDRLERANHSEHNRWRIGLQSW